MDFLLGFLLLLIRQTLKDFKGIGFWAITCFIVAIGYLLFGLRDQIPDFLSIILANMLFYITAIVRIIGFYGFFERRIKPFVKFLGWAFGVLFLVGFIYFTYFI